MELISTTTVGSGGALTIEFSAIPQTYTDLLLVVSPRSLGGGYNAIMDMKINNDTSVYYTEKSLYGTGSSAGSGNYTTNTFFRLGWISGASSTANSFGSMKMLIPNYAGSTNKSASWECVSEHNDPQAYQFLGAGLFPKTTAVTSLQLFENGGGFAQYSTASLYGILKGSGGASVS
jgi:hypothetical protein